MLDNLIKQTAQGSKEAFSELYKNTKASVYGFALSICQNVQDAEDVLQEVYVHVYESAAGYTSCGKPMAWLLTITRNLCMSKIREKQRMVLMPPEDWQEQFAGQEAVTNEDRLLIQHLLTMLSDQERQIVVLHALTGLKHREIAALLDVPLPTILSKYKRAIGKLQKSIKEEN